MHPVPTFLGFNDPAKISRHTKHGFILCGFPGIGKTELVAEHPTIMPGYRIVEIQTSEFWKEANGNGNDIFAVEYCQAASDARSSNKIVLVSTHPEMLRQLLKKKDVLFVLVHPLRHEKDEWITRLKSSGSSDAVVNMIRNNWDALIDKYEECQKYCPAYPIGGDARLFEVIKDVVECVRKEIDDVACLLEKIERLKKEIRSLAEEIWRGGEELSREEEERLAGLKRLAGEVKDLEKVLSPETGERLEELWDELERLRRG